MNTVDRNGLSPLYRGTKYNCVDIVRVLIDQADKDAITSDGMTALHSAAMRNHIDIVVNLIDAGALLDSKDRSGNTPLRSVEHGKLLILCIYDQGLEVQTAR